jgi:predicted DCC family thiol-disulfide oxidoreductase YuxK
MVSDVVKGMERGELPEPATSDSRILLFDGLCYLCSGALQFVYRRDQRALFKFAWVQSELGSRLAEWCGLPTDEYETMVYIEGGVPYVKSTAFLRAVRLLRFPWPLLSVGLLVPVTVRDWVYDLLARNRYRVFGKKDACAVPTGDLKQRFLPSS